MSLAEFVYPFVALAVLALACRYGLGPTLIVAAYRRDAELARSCWQAARIRRRWRHLARALGLVLPDKAHQGPVGSSTDAGPGSRPKYTAPKIRVRSDAFGVTATVKTVPGVGLVDVQKQAAYLADAWRCVRVAVTQDEPGKLRVRAVRRDPLAVPTEYRPDPAELAAPASLDALDGVAVNEYAEAVSLRLSGVSGIVVGGIPGAGKTSFLLGVISRLAPSDAVQFVIFDGKVDDPATEGDYLDVADRCAVMVGDDLEAANGVLTQLVELRRARSRSIRTLLGTVNVWHVGPSELWPLLVIVIDEAHTFFKIVKDGGVKEIKSRNALADQNAQMVEDLIKKGRSVGILVIVATQKPTSDSIPTAIRDVCGVSICFAVRTIDSAVAVLGDDIRQYPEASPVDLQGAEYVGCAVLAVEGRRGFIRARTPFTSSATAAAVTGATGLLCGRRGELPAVPAPAMIGTADDDD